MKAVLRICASAILFLFAAICVNAQNINTIAGGIGDGGPATNASLLAPNYICLDRAGNLYVSDFNNHVIRKIDPSGSITLFAGTPGYNGYNGDRDLAIYAHLNRPSGIVADTSGNIYIADNYNYKIRKVNTNGAISTFGNLSRQAVAICIDDNQNIYAASSDQLIYKITPSGVQSIFANNTGRYGDIGDGGYALNAGFGSIAGLCTDHSGNVYVSDATYNKIRIIYSSGIINTFAGTGESGFLGDGGAATAAKFNNIGGISADNAGNIYVADKNNHVIRKINTTGIITTIAGTLVTSGNTGDGGPANAAKLYAPSYALPDAAGNVYIADFNNSKIRKINTSGIISTYAGVNTGIRMEHLADGAAAKAAILNQPSGIYYDTLRNLYITEKGINCIRKIDPLGIITTIGGNDTSGFSGDGGPATNARFSGPVGVVKDARGNLYVCDKNNNRIRKISAAGIVTTYAGGGSRPANDGSRADTVSFTQLNAMAIDKSGNLYLFASNKIRKIDTNRILTTICGTGVSGFSGDGGPATIAAISDVYAILIGQHRKVYFAEYYNHRVRVIDSNGIVSTFAGQGSNLTFGDGTPANTAGVPNPNGLTIDKQGNVYISTSEYIRKVNTSGIISKYAGSSSGTRSDGQPAIATLVSNYYNTIVGMATDTTGNLYFTDYGQNKLKVIYNAGISVSTPVITYCTPTSATFTATATASPGVSIRYRWIKNGIAVGTDSFKYTAPLLRDSDIVYCNVTNGSSTTVLASSNKITIKVHSIPVVASVNFTFTPSSTVCIGTSVICTPYPTNGGTAPIYNWVRNNVLAFTGPIYRFVPDSGDVVYCQMRSNEYCLESDTVRTTNRTITVNSRKNPVATFDTYLDTVLCPGLGVNVRINVLNAGGTVTYEWYKNNVYVGNNYEYFMTPLDRDSLFCKVRIANGCLNYDTAISPVRHFYVKKPAVSFTSSKGSAVCPGESTTLIATSIHGGPSPVYHWYKNNVLVYSGDTFIASPSIGDSIYCYVVSNLSCILYDSSKSNTLLFTSPAIRYPSVYIDPTNGLNICHGKSANFIATSFFGGSSPIYKWYVNDLDTVRMVGSTFYYLPNNGDIVRCLLTSNAGCLFRDTAWSLPLTMNVRTPDTAAITAIADIGEEICENDNVKCTITTVNAGPKPKYAWYLNNSNVSTATTYNFKPSNGQELFCTLTNDSGCLVSNTVYSNTLKFNVSKKVKPKVTITSDQSMNLCRPIEVNFIAIGENEGSMPIFKWYVNNTFISSGKEFTYTPKNLDGVMCEMTSNFRCITNPVHLSSKSFTIADSPTISISSDIGPVIYRGNNVQLTANIAGGRIHKYEVQWYVNNQLISTTSTNTSTYTNNNFNDWDSVYCIVNYEGTCTGSMRSNTILINTYHNLKIHPNPNTGTFAISLNDYSVNAAQANIEVYDMMGKLVHSETTHFNIITLYQEIKLSDYLPSGVYLLKVYYDKTKLSKVFVVKH